MGILRALTLIVVLSLAGCADSPVPGSKLVGPAAVLMVAPDPLPDIKEGEDVARHAIKVRKMYGKEASKLRRLQRWVRVVTKK